MTLPGAASPSLALPQLLRDHPHLQRLPSAGWADRSSLNDHERDQGTKATES